MGKTSKMILLGNAICSLMCLFTSGFNIGKGDFTEACVSFTVFIMSASAFVISFKRLSKRENIEK